MEKHEEKGKSKKIKTVLITLLLIIIAGSLSAMAYIYYNFNTMKGPDLPPTDKDKGIDPIVTTKESNEIRSIAFFGIDIGRDKSDPPHSDSIIIATIDNKHKKVKLTSIMRDSYVAIEGHGKSKITEAYTLGGPTLAVKTLNQNFNLNIRDYVSVNFFGMEKIIDSLGGVNVDIKTYEVKEVNKYITELAKIGDTEADYIKAAGNQTLSGIQAVAYSRVRYVGNGDFERTSRQRTVLTELFNKIQSAGVTKYPALVSSLSSFVTTSLSATDIIQTGTSVLSSNINTLEQERFPLDGYCKGDTIGETWYLVLKPDIKTTARQISDYILEDIKPVPKDPLF